MVSQQRQRLLERQSAQQLKTSFAKQQIIKQERKQIEEQQKASKLNTELQEVKNKLDEGKISSIEQIKPELRQYLNIPKGYFENVKTYQQQLAEYNAYKNVEKFADKGKVWLLAMYGDGLEKKIAKKWLKSESMRKKSNQVKKPTSGVTTTTPTNTFPTKVCFLESNPITGTSTYVDQITGLDYTPTPITTKLTPKINVGSPLVKPSEVSLVNPDVEYKKVGKGQDILTYDKKSGGAVIKTINIETPISDLIPKGSVKDEGITSEATTEAVNPRTPNIIQEKTLIGEWTGVTSPYGIGGSQIGITYPKGQEPIISPQTKESIVSNIRGAEQFVVESIFPKEKERRLQQEAISQQYESIGSRIESFNKKYEGKELTQEEYNIAVKEQSNLQSELESLQNYEEQRKQDIYEQDIGSIGEDFLGFGSSVIGIGIPTGASSFSKGVVRGAIKEIPESLIYGIELATAPNPLEYVAESVMSFKEIPQMIASEPFGATGEIVGGIVMDILVGKGISKLKAELRKPKVVGIKSFDIDVKDLSKNTDINLGKIIDEPTGTIKLGTSARELKTYGFGEEIKILPNKVLVELSSEQKSVFRDWLNKLDEGQRKGFVNQLSELKRLSPEKIKLFGENLKGALNREIKKKVLKKPSFDIDVKDLSKNTDINLGKIIEFDIDVDELKGELLKKKRTKFSETFSVEDVKKKDVNLNKVLQEGEIKPVKEIKQKQPTFQYKILPDELSKEISKSDLDGIAQKQKGGTRLLLEPELKQIKKLEIKEKVFEILPEREIQKIRTKQLTKTKLRQVQAGRDFDIIPMLSQESGLKRRQKLKAVLLPKELEKSMSKELSISAIKVRQKLKESLRQPDIFLQSEKAILKQPQKVIQRQSFDVRVPNEPIQRYKLLEEPKLKIGFKREEEKIPKKKLKQEAYNVYVKVPKKKSYSKITKKPVSRRDAENLRAFAIDESTSRQGYIKRVKTKPSKLNYDIPPTYSRDNDFKFRKFKQKKGKKIPLINRVIEKSKYMQDTRNEKKDLSVFRTLARVEKKKLNKINKPFGLGFA